MTGVWIVLLILFICGSIFLGIKKKYLLMGLSIVAAIVALVLLVSTILLLGAIQ